MVIVLWVVALPFLYWVWLGITLTIVDYAIYLAWKETDMVGTFVNAAGETVERARIIRYGSIAREAYPDLLSQYDEAKNIIVIDKVNAAGLPQQVIERLEMTTFPATRAANNTVGFEAY